VIQNFNSCLALVTSDSKKSRSSVWRLLGYLLRYRFRIGLGVVFSFLVSIANLASITALVPVFNAIGESGPIEIVPISREDMQTYERLSKAGPLEVLDTLRLEWTAGRLKINSLAEGRSSREVVLLLCAFILPTYLVKLAFLTLSFYCIGTAGLMAVRDLRVELYSKLNELGLQHFTENQTGFIMSRIINDAEAVGRSLSSDFQEGLVDIFYVITCMTFLALVSWQMLVITLLLIPLLSSPVARFAKKIRGAAMGQQERLAELGAHIHEILSGIRVIRAFSMQRFESGRFQQVNQRLYQNTFKGHYYHQVGPALTEFVATIAVAGFLYWGAYQISVTGQTRGEFFAFIFVMGFLMKPIKQLSVLVNMMSAAGSAGTRIFELIDTPAGIKEAVVPRRLRSLESHISFEGLHFTYPGTEREVLSDITFRVERGQTTAFVGSSGAGKSTLMDLLPRFYDPTKGRIVIDGTDIRDYSLRDLRTSIGIVTQNIFLFHTSIRENISYGRLDIPMERIEQVARAANAHDFICELPQGYETSVGESGVLLSGGQKQRIAIARAILLDPSILIFDEATSALDNESEKLVHEAMERLLEGRTVFIIAHRLSTVRKANCIYVLDQGKIVERGHHDELVQAGSVYQQLYSMQFYE
jgi:ABC-type multidrug transport system fused ATPase/permease subunit